MSPRARGALRYCPLRANDDAWLCNEGYLRVPSHLLLPLLSQPQCHFCMLFLHLAHAAKPQSQSGLVNRSHRDLLVSASIADPSSCHVVDLWTDQIGVSVTVAESDGRGCYSLQDVT